MKHYEIYLGNYDAMKTVDVMADHHVESDTDLLLYRKANIGRKSKGEITAARFKLDTVLGWSIQKDGITPTVSKVSHTGPHAVA